MECKASPAASIQNPEWYVDVLMLTPAAQAARFNAICTEPALIAQRVKRGIAPQGEALVAVPSTYCRFVCHDCLHDKSTFRLLHTCTPSSPNATVPRRPRSGVPSPAALRHSSARADGAINARR